MGEKVTTKLRIKSGSLELDFEGDEAFLRAEVPKLVQVTTDLQVAKLSESMRVLHSELQESLVSKAELEKEIDSIKSDLDSMSELGEMESLRLQMAMDRMSKAFQTLSNIMKKSHETANQIIQNLK